MVLVITGGEPTLQENLEGFLLQMIPQFQVVQIETNGILLKEYHGGVYTVVSPKCAEKNGKPTEYLKPHQAMRRRANCMKFVMSADAESPYHTIPDWAFRWRDDTHNAIYVSPMNIYSRKPRKRTDTMEARTQDEVVSFWEPGLLNAEANQLNHEYAARYCLQNGLRLSLQTHLYASLA